MVLSFNYFSELISSLDKPNDYLTNLASLSTILSLIIVLLLLIPGRKIYKYLKGKYFYDKLKPFYSEGEVKRAIENYIPTKCQNVDPAQEHEPNQTYAYATKNNLLDFFIERLDGIESNKYYIILADSGMGKTTFMINLFYKYIKGRKKKHNISIIPLGYLQANIKIQEISNKENTILLLDAFDEDPEAVIDFKKRIEDIIKLTIDFHSVIITSRTQFFPKGIEEPLETGIFLHGTDKGTHKFKKLYISPFDTNDIEKYLCRKYSLIRYKKRQKAKAIVLKSPNLMVRPMLLQYIDHLIESNETYRYSAQIYDNLVSKWIARERIENKSELLRFTNQIAQYIYDNRRSKGLFIEAQEIDKFAKDNKINLSDFEMKGRSLLNRNVEGKYKFAHKSILEFLVARKCFTDVGFLSTINFAEEMQVKRFFNEFVLWRYFEPLVQKCEKCQISIKDKTIHIKDLTGQNLQEVTWLKIYNPHINIDLKYFTVFESLRGFQLYKGYSNNNDYLNKIPNLAYLSFINCQITDLKWIKHLPNLRSLNLDSNQITDIMEVKRLKKLKDLSLANNAISDVSPLSTLKDLSSLNLRNNYIDKITHLSPLTNLLVLDLRNNPISDSLVFEIFKGRKTRVYSGRMKDAPYISVEKIYLSQSLKEYNSKLMLPETLRYSTLNDPSLLKTRRNIITNEEIIRYERGIDLLMKKIELIDELESFEKGINNKTE